MSAVPSVFITRGRVLMGRMALTMRCQIKRVTPTGTDEYGQTTYTDPFVLASNVPCHLYQEIGGEQRTPEREAMVRQWVLLVSRSQDVTADDTIAQIADPLGVVIVPGPVAITDVTPQATHLRLSLAGLA